jgi:carbon-monoxide dehydrogenase medium subunit
MKPPPFEYLRPGTVAEAVAHLGDLGSEAKVLAGGQSLVPMLNLRLARPAVLVDINHLQLDSIERVDGGLRVGATVRQQRLIDEKVVAETLPILAHVARFIAHPAIRNRGTVGGSIAHADPAAELALIAVLSGATMIVSSSSGEREIAAEDFFQGTFTTALGEDDLLIAVEFRSAGGAMSFGFAEVAERDGDFALASAAVQLHWSHDAVSGARVAVSGGADVPLRLEPVETLVHESGAGISPEVRNEAGSLARGAVEPMGDIHATADHRRALIGELVARALKQAVEGYRP